MQSIYSKNLNLMRCRRHRWLTGALLDANHYMYLCYTWPGLLMSKFCRWISLRERLYPQMAAQAKEFDLMVENLIQEVQAYPREKGFYAAVSCAKDPQTGRRYPEEEIWRELKMLTRAGEASQILHIPESFINYRCGHCICRSSRHIALSLG